MPSRLERKDLIDSPCQPFPVTPGRENNLDGRPVGPGRQDVFPGKGKRELSKLQPEYQKGADHGSEHLPSPPGVRPSGCRMNDARHFPPSRTGGVQILPNMMKSRPGVKDKSREGKQPRRRSPGPGHFRRTGPAGHEAAPRLSSLPWAKPLDYVERAFPADFRSSSWRWRTIRP